MTDKMTADDVTAMITATLHRAVADGVPVVDAVNAAISAVAVYASEEEGPFMAGARMITAGGALTSPKVLKSHAQTLN